MTIDEINKELDNLEIKDLYSAIKGNILGSLKVALENSNKNKVEFYNNLTLDEIVRDIEDQVDELICNYDIYNIEFWHGTSDRCENHPYKYTHYRGDNKHCK